MSNSTYIVESNESYEVNMVSELKNVIEILNRQVDFFQKGWQTETEMQRSVESIMRFYLKRSLIKKKLKAK